MWKLTLKITLSQWIVFVHATELSNHTGGNQAFRLQGLKWALKRFHPVRQWWPLLFPAVGTSHDVFWPRVTHWFRKALLNKLAVTKEIAAQVLHSSFWPGKDVSLLHSTWEIFPWGFPLKKPQSGYQVFQLIAVNHCWKEQLQTF